jgi:Uma2 family endonuclease
MSANVVTESPGIAIPTITDLDAFRRWAFSPEFPQHGWFAYLDGRLWVDLSMEKAVPNLIKSCFCAYLTILVNDNELGMYFGDRMLLTNRSAKLSTEPDGMFASYRSVRSRRARLEKGKDAPELIGSPDMTLEIISRASAKKDKILLPPLYWNAGVREYWLVDSREEEPQLHIYRRGPQKYRAVRNVVGWVKSAVFGQSFRLVRRDTRHGLVAFRLVMKGR